MPEPISILDLKPQYAALQTEMDAAILDVVRSGHYINGPVGKALEGELATYLGAKKVVNLNSGTDALHLALRALNIGPGDEVITVPFTFVATTEAIGIVGATPVFVDIDPATFNLDPRLLEAAITPRTRAILPVHLYGQPADMGPILDVAKRHNLHVVEDCAQAIGAAWHGRKVGTLGTIGCFSFFPSKNLGCYGDGGAVCTDDEALAARVLALRGHGGRVKYHHEELGVNSRLDELQAAVLRVKLPHLEAWSAGRRKVAARYDALLTDVPGVVTPGTLPDTVPVFHQYTVRVPNRDEVQKALAAEGIQTMVYYPVPLHRQEVHARLGLAEGRFPESDRAAAEVLSLPIYPELTEAQQDRVVATLRAALQKVGGAAQPAGAR